MAPWSPIHTFLTLDDCLLEGMKMVPKPRRWHRYPRGRAEIVQWLDEIERACNKCQDPERLMILESLGRIIEDDDQRANEAAAPRRYITTISLLVGSVAFTVSATQTENWLWRLSVFGALLLDLFAYYVLLEPLTKKSGREEFRDWLEKVADGMAKW